MPNGAYKMITIGDRRSITVLYNGQLKTMADNDPAFVEVCLLVMDGKYDEAILMFDKESLVKNSVESSTLSDRIEVRNGNVYLDGEACDNHITEMIIGIAEQGGDYVPLANYFALLSDNPIHHSRHRLDDWLRASGTFSLDSDGYIIGYKGLRSDFRSSHAGPGIVNGYPINGNLDNSPGNTLEIEEVEFDPNIGCAHGLHVGTFEYARDWAGPNGRLVSVRVSPADVGSVPTDSNDAKMRVFKYEVIEEVSAPYQDRIVK